MSKILFELKNVWFRYKFNKNWIFRGINLKIMSGSWVIAGPNGSGKTTLIKLLMGVLKPNKGEVLLFGEKKVYPKLVRKYLIYVPTNIRNFLVGPRVIDEIEKTNSSELLEFFREHSINLGLNKPIYYLSEGQMRILANLVAIFSNKEIVVLDEPTIGLDRKYRRILMDAIKLNEGKKNFLIVSNDVRILSKFSKMIYVDGLGSILMGESKKLFYEIESLRENNPVVAFAMKKNIVERPISVEEIVNILKGDEICQASS